MRETEKRIRQYRAQLPRIRERIIASLVLFAFSIVMMTMSAFAWTTLSISPEVSGVKTTIAANGNLEIALANAIEMTKDADGNDVPVRDADGNVIPIVPGDSLVGDSNLTLVSRNQTWGNLINLSDPSYGLDNIILRPATLNDGLLKSKPLMSMTYGYDGRVIEKDTNFAYTQWKWLDTGMTKGEFVYSENLGVKAVSSVKQTGATVTSPLGGEYTKGLDEVNTHFSDARTALKEIADLLETKDGQDSPIAGILTTYMNGTVVGDVENAVCSEDDIEALLEILTDTDGNGSKSIDGDVLEAMGQAVMKLFYLYQMDTYVVKSDYDEWVTENPNTPYPMPDTVKTYASVDDFLANVDADLAAMNTARSKAGKMILNASNFSTLYALKSFKKTLWDETETNGKPNGCITGLQAALSSGQTIYWKDVKTYVNKIVNINTCLINGKTASAWTGNLTANALDLVGMMGEGKANSNNTVVKGGLIYDLEASLHINSGIRIDKIVIALDRTNLEKRVEDQSSVIKLAVASLSDPVIIEANVTTSAPTDVVPSKATADMGQANTILDAAYIVYNYTAQDTYGLSIDFWIRSNAPQTYLTLEGDVITVDEPIKVYIDSIGDEVEIFLATVDSTKTFEDGSEPETASMLNQEVYKYNNVWYYYIGQTAVERTVEETDASGTLVSTTVYKIRDTVNKTEPKVVGYSGVNRIWDETNLEKYLDQKEHIYSTSQGSGSCYTFYADPNDLETILDLLELMRVAFVDASGNLLATAKLDTSLCYSDYGKHIVPLVLYSGYTEIQIGEETYRGITKLEKNEANLITALIYLEGSNIENKDVLASSDIDGQFNIQFGSTYLPEALEDEKLMTETLRITAAANKTKFEATEVAEDGKYHTTVTLNIEGMDKVSGVQAYFLRAISETQGTRQQTMTFTKVDDKTWTYDCAFTAPGTYILRSATVDGIERALTTPITITIEGFKVGEVTSEDNKPSYYTEMRSGNYYSETFSVNINTENVTPPKTVRGVFVNENNVSVTVNFAKDTDSAWEGTANFTTSGTYILQYLLIDGEYYEVNALTRVVYLGLKTKVSLKALDTYDPEKEQYSYDPDTGYSYIYNMVQHEYGVSAEVYDDTGRKIKSLGGEDGIWVNYSNNLSTKVVWSGVDDAYVGGKFLINQVGVYSFVSVKIDANNTVTNAIDTLKITAISSDPFEYLGAGDVTDYFVVDAEAETAFPTVQLNFKYAQSASVYGKFAYSRSEDGLNTTDAFRILKATYVEGDSDDVGTFVFTIPKEDGYYRLKEVKLSNVYYEDANGQNGKFYMEDDSFKVEQDENGNDIPWTAEEFDGATEENYYSIKFDGDMEPVMESTKVVKTITLGNVSYPNAFSGAFLEKHTITSASVTLRDFEGKEVQGVSDVKLSVGYKTTTRTYSTNNTDINDGKTDHQTFELDLTGDGSGKYSWSGEKQIYIAGSYGVTLEYTVGTTAKTKTLDDIVITSTMPTVKISSVSPNTSMNADTSSGSGHTTKTNEKTDTTATVYIKCTREQSNGFMGIGAYDRHKYTASSVSISLSNSGYASDARLNFYDSDGQLTSYLFGSISNPTGQENTTVDSTSAYAWNNANNTINGCDAIKLLYVGYSKYSNFLGTSNGSKTPAGTITANTLVMTFDGVEYSITIPTITIKNPY
ncbi:MAG: hypothetical protein IJ489_11285 [Clostridia bacterium]|nr:hypothetical protein [Clostridia bacterium]